jgi:acetyl-CoA acetyltransferase
MRADDLAAKVVRSLLDRQPNLSPDKVEDLVLGCAFPEHTQGMLMAGMLMARGVAILAGLPEDSAAKVVRSLLDRQPNLSPDKVEDLVLGCAFPEHTQGMLMANAESRSGSKTCSRFRWVATTPRFTPS